MASPRPLPPIGDWLGRAFRALPGGALRMTIVGIMGSVLAWIAMLAVVVLACVAVALIQGTDFVDRIKENPERLGLLLEDPSLGVGIQLVAFVAMLVGARIWVIFVLAMQHLALGTAGGVLDSLRRARPRSLAFFGLVIVQSLLVQLAALALIIPGIVVGVYLAMAHFVFADADAGIMESLRRSWRLVRGRWWSVLGRLLLVALIALPMMIVPVLGWIAGPCLCMLGAARLYQDLRDTPDGAAAGAARHPPGRPSRPADPSRPRPGTVVQPPSRSPSASSLKRQ